MIYLDNAATTAVQKEVLEAMLPYYRDRFGNPSGSYEFATDTRNDVENARRIIAGTIGALPEEIYFTSGGTEADNWALRNVAENYVNKGRHIITTKIEHHAILHTCEFLEKKGFEITYINVDEYGIINVRELQRAIRKDTILISVMYANNEIGTIQPIEQIGRIAKRAGVLFHTDAVQAYCHVPINVKRDNIDFLSASGHKIHGPKGVGFMYARKDVKLSPMIFGGGQEMGRRAGTENVPGIIGLSKAAQLGTQHLTERMWRVRIMRDYMINRILWEIPFVKINGHRQNRLSGNINMSFRFVDGATLLAMLDMEGVCASGGSACNSASAKPSHVLQALGLTDRILGGTIRMTIEEDTTKEEIDRTVLALKKCVNELRTKSEEYNKSMKNWR